jgi:hypothetical protein
LSFAWSGLARVNDASDSIELWFSRGGLAVIRNRVFPTNEDRKAFLDTVEDRRRGAQDSGSSTAR